MHFKVAVFFYYYYSRSSSNGSVELHRQYTVPVLNVHIKEFVAHTHESFLWLHSSVKGAVILVQRCLKISELLS